MCLSCLHRLDQPRSFGRRWLLPYTPPFAVSIGSTLAAAKAVGKKIGIYALSVPASASSHCRWDFIFQPTPQKHGPPSSLPSNPPRQSVRARLCPFVELG